VALQQRISLVCVHGRIAGGARGRCSTPLPPAVGEIGNFYPVENFHNISVQKVKNALLIIAKMF